MNPCNRESHEGERFPHIYFEMFQKDLEMKAAWSKSDFTAYIATMLTIDNGAFFNRKTSLM